MKRSARQSGISNRVSVEHGPVEVTATAPALFRDPDAFESLSKHVFPSLVKKRKVPSDRIRVWVPGCASGEEAYSLGIALLEYIWSQPDESKPIHPIQIFATDTSEAALDRARSGVYSEEALAEVSPARLERFFTKAESGYQIKKAVREVCVFAKQDVINDPPFAHLDLIDCRALLPHLTPEVQRQVIPRLHYGLKIGGYLLLGGKDGLSAFSDYFVLLDEAHRIYQKRNRAMRMITYFAGADYKVGNNEEAGEPREFPTLYVLEKEADRLLLMRFAPSSLVLNSDMEIVQFRGMAGSYLEQAAGHPILNLSKQAAGHPRRGLLPALHVALHRAQKENKSTLTRDVRIPSAEGAPHGGVRVDLEVIPVQVGPSRERFFVVVFQERTGGRTQTEAQKRRAKVKSNEASLARENERLRNELRALRDEMQSLIQEQETTFEEFKSANEEVLSSNEELQSTNEELEAAKEELEAGNSELSVLNEEIQARNEELSSVNADFVNLFSNVSVPLLMVNNELRIRKFTPPAGALLNLLSTDVGRPLRQIRTNLDVNLEEMALRTMESTQAHEREVRDTKGAWYLMRARPYRTLDDRIDGAVISFQDIDALKHSLDETTWYADTLIETAREPVLVLDSDLRVVVANHTFYTIFKTSKEETEKKLIHELGSGQWGIPRLREMLQEITQNKVRIEDFEVRDSFPGLGERILLLNARRIQPDPKRPLIILTIEDVTDKHTQVEALIRQSALLELARDAVMIRDLDGTVHYWNRGAEEMYGWTKNEAFNEVTHKLLRTQFPQPWEEIEEQLRSEGHWEGELVHTRKDGQRRIVSSRWALLSQGSTPPVILEINTDISEQKHSEERLRQLSGYLMQVQDEERRRIARELHDSTGQKLAAAKLQLDFMARDPELKARERSLTESSDLIDEAFQEIRTLSQLLHPPLLDAAGLVSATRWMVDGFSNRANIRVKLNVSGDLARLPQPLELALFRVTQECLNNIRRHSGAKEAEIDLAKNGESVTLEVHDNGKGIPPEVLCGTGNGDQVMGVGILGMKERLSQLGGNLEIESGPSGTTVRATVPLEKAAGLPA